MLNFNNHKCTAGSGSHKPSSTCCTAKEGGETPRIDAAINSVIDESDETLRSVLAESLSCYVETETISSSWKKSKRMVLFKKSEKEDLRYYRPIYLLPQVYNLFTKIISIGLSASLDE
ncbi:unnamed protein product [Soboliphyme baturini]|uniref:Reverse transcriptase domain-containing protein n=1 Tax=Soboliphyme baturini TaxID=241478 RepID=A0A183IIR1_9BILA|nr:unnamed protein product [Soboliphyme baturini]